MTIKIKSSQLKAEANWKVHKNGTIYDNIAPWYGLETPFELAITGHLFDFLRESKNPNDIETFKAIISNAKIFAWMSPDGKANLVEAL